MSVLAAWCTHTGLLCVHHPVQGAQAEPCRSSRFPLCGAARCAVTPMPWGESCLHIVSAVRPHPGWLRSPALGSDSALAFLLAQAVRCWSLVAGRDILWATTLTSVHSSVHVLVDSGCDSLPVPISLNTFPLQFCPDLTGCCAQFHVHRLAHPDLPSLGPRTFLDPSVDSDPEHQCRKCVSVVVPICSPGI